MCHQRNPSPEPEQPRLGCFRNPLGLHRPLLGRQGSISLGAEGSWDHGLKRCGRFDDDYDCKCYGHVNQASRAMTNGAVASITPMRQDGELSMPTRHFWLLLLLAKSNMLNNRHPLIARRLSRARAPCNCQSMLSGPN